MDNLEYLGKSSYDFCLLVIGVSRTAERYPKHSSNAMKIIYKWIGLEIEPLN